MKASKAIGAVVPWILILVGVAVMYQVARRSGLSGAATEIVRSVSSGGGSRTSAASAAASAGPTGGGFNVAADLVSGPFTGEATGGGKGISGPNASPIASTIGVTAGSAPQPVVAAAGPVVSGWRNYISGVATPTNPITGESGWKFERGANIPIALPIGPVRAQTRTYDPVADEAHFSG